MRARVDVKSWYDTNYFCVSVNVAHVLHGQNAGVVKRLVFLDLTSSFWSAHAFQSIFKIAQYRVSQESLNYVTWSHLVMKDSEIYFNKQKSSTSGNYQGKAILLFPL